MQCHETSERLIDWHTGPGCRNGRDGREDSWLTDGKTRCATNCVYSYVEVGEGLIRRNGVTGRVLNANRGKMLREKGIANGGSVPSTRGDVETGAVGKRGNPTRRGM